MKTETRIPIRAKVKEGTSWIYAGHTFPVESVHLESNRFRPEDGRELRIDLRGSKFFESHGYAYTYIYEKDLELEYSPTPSPTVEEKRIPDGLKTLCFKLDREVWAKVEVHEATQSWGREQSAKLILEWLNHEPNNSIGKIVQSAPIDKEKPDLHDTLTELYPFTEGNDIAHNLAKREGFIKCWYTHVPPLQEENKKLREEVNSTVNIRQQLVLQTRHIRGLEDELRQSREENRIDDYRDAVNELKEAQQEIKELRLEIKDLSRFDER